MLGGILDVLDMLDAWMHSFTEKMKNSKPLKTQNKPVMSLHNMKSLSAKVGIHPNTLYNYRKRIIERNPKLKEQFGEYGKKTSHLLTRHQLQVLKENIPQLRHLDI